MSHMTNKPYPQEELDWIAEYYPTHSLADTVKAFNEHFGTDYNHRMITNRVRKLNLPKRNTRWGKGSVPWNKGLNYENDRPDLYESQYLSNWNNTKGRKPVGCVTRYEVGTISRKINHTYGNMIKVAQPNEWVAYSRYVYEKETGTKLGEKDRVLHLNGNKFDDRFENLVVVNDAILIRLNRQGLISKDGDLTRVAVTKEMLLQKIKELENDRTGKKKHKKKN